MREKGRDESPTTIFLSAGETSGDLYGSYLAKSLREEFPKVSLKGMGGRYMMKAGVELIFHSTHLGAIGLVESLKVVPAFLLAFKKIKRELTLAPPELLILIDFGAFNVKLGKWAKKKGIKILYFIPPGSWRRKIKRKEVRMLKDFVDEVVCLFPWYKEALEKEGIKANFFGHPLLDILQAKDKKSARLSLALPEGIVVGFLPGSRRQEIRNILPSLLECTPLIKRKEPKSQFVIAPPSIPGIFSPSFLPPGWRKEDNTLRKGEEIVHLREGKPWEVISASYVVVVTSGTASLEAVILGTPLVVVYKGSKLTIWEYHLRRKHLPPYVSLPNLILERKAFPELLGNNASPEGISRTVLSLLQEGERNKQLEAMKEIKSCLGERGMFRQTAILIKRMLEAEVSHLGRATFSSSLGGQG